MKASGPSHDVRSNCILWAFAMWWRRRGCGRRRYVKWRGSDWGWFPHCLYCERRISGAEIVVSYKPADPKKKALPPPLFVGAVRWGDKPNGSRE